MKYTFFLIIDFFRYLQSKLTIFDIMSLTLQMLSKGRVIDLLTVQSFTQFGKLLRDSTRDTALFSCLDYNRESIFILLIDPGQM